MHVWTALWLIREESGFVSGVILHLLLLLMVYYKIVALDESELRNYLQTLVKNIKKYLVRISSS